ncbi:hypothetical protein ACIRRX_25270 [Streptomyces bacillaris]|uniref:hypothetical protein n=1 Tax=unclassified Streptomyces TaxID=2593676 RepID=UPI0003600C45|nr:MULTISPECIES: hypothetical protein [unclassified Streptomyces]MYT38647.1 hypothetical protein [Streptomyces sp. SID8356]
MAADSTFVLDVPEGFDDSDEETGVHPVARKLFLGRDNAATFDKAHRWLSLNPVRVADVSWDYLDGEDEPYCLSVYFTFEEPASA